MTGSALPPIPLWSDHPSSTDFLGFVDIAEPVIEAVQRERLDPVAVGIFGDWGSGKTTILDLISNSLGAYDRIVVVNTRPWEYDPTLDPRASLVAEVLGAVRNLVEANEGLWTKTKDRFDALAKRVQWSKAITLTTKSAMTFSLPSIDDLVGIFSEEGEGAEMTLQGFRDEFSDLMCDLETIDRVVVLVDDLDRCLPETVIATLETIKLFLSVEKMAFVLAADSRLVQLAIAQRFDGTSRGDRMAREYLEKIVQIPVSVPALGLGDTEAYLALMFLDRHFENADELLKVVKHCDDRRHTAQPQVFGDIPDGMLPPAAADDVALAGMLAPVLYEQLEGNPRRLKRFLNAFWIRSGIAQRRGVAPDETALAKLMVLEQLEPDAFGQLLEWLGDGTLTEKLELLEGGEEVAGQHSAFSWWSAMSPPLTSMDLNPYMRLAASLRRQSGPRSELRSDLAELLNILRSNAVAERKKGRERLATLPATDRSAITREIVNTMRTEPSTQEQLVETLNELLEDDALTGEITSGLRSLDPARIDAGIVIALGGDHPGAEETKAVVREWSDSGRLGEIPQNAASEVLGDA